MHFSQFRRLEVEHRGTGKLASPAASLLGEHMAALTLCPPVAASLCACLWYLFPFL